MNVLDIFRRPASTVEAMRAKLAELKEIQPSLAAAARTAATARSKALLSGTDAQVAKLEAALADAVREADRAAVAIEQLDYDLRMQEEAEALAAINAARDAAEKRATEFANSFLSRYAEHAKPLAELMHDYADIERAISDANSDALDHYRRHDTITAAPAPVRPIADRISNGRSLHSPHLAVTRIVPGHDHPGFGAER